MTHTPIRRVLYRFRPYLHGQLPLLLASLAALLGMTLMRLLEPWPLAWIVDNLLKNKTPPLGLTTNQLIWASALAVIAFAALRALCGYLSTIGFARIGTQVLSRVRNDLYNQLLTLPLSYHQKMRPGDLTLRLVNDVSQLKEVTVSALLPMLANIFVLAGMFAVMLALNWQLALLSLIPLPVMWYSAKHSSRLIHEASRRTRSREGALAATASESMAAIRTVQSLTLENKFRHLFEGSDDKAMNADMSTKRLSAGLERTIDLLVACATALVLWQGARQVLAGQLSAGDLLVFISYLKNSMRPVREYAKYAGRLSKALASAERIADILDETPEIADLPHSRPAPPLRGPTGSRRRSAGHRTTLFPSPTPGRRTGRSPSWRRAAARRRTPGTRAPGRRFKRATCRPRRSSRRPTRLRRRFPVRSRGPAGPGPRTRCRSRPFMIRAGSLRPRLLSPPLAISAATSASMSTKVPGAA